MTSREKVLAIERQIINGCQTETGIRFDCPFCGLSSTPDNGVLCCNEASEVVLAIIQHAEHLERCAVVEKSLERFDKMRSQPLLN